MTPTKLLTERHEALLEAAGGKKALTARETALLIIKFRLKTPKALSKEVDRMRRCGLPVRVKIPYAAARALMGVQGDYLPKSRDGEWDRRDRYIKTADDEGQPENGRCPRCPRLGKPQKTWLQNEDGFLWCAACGWAEDWPDYLPLECVV